MASSAVLRAAEEPTAPKTWYNNRVAVIIPYNKMCIRDSIADDPHGQAKGPARSRPLQHRHRHRSHGQQHGRHAEEFKPAEDIDLQKPHGQKGQRVYEPFGEKISAGHGWRLLILHTMLRTIPRRAKPGESRPRGIGRPMELLNNVERFDHENLLEIVQVSGGLYHRVAAHPCLLYTSRCV